MSNVSGVDESSGSVGAVFFHSGIQTRHGVALVSALFAALAPAISLAATLTRGPYLQLLSERAVTIVWNTESAAACAVAIRRLDDSTSTVVSGQNASVCVLPVENLRPGAAYAYTPLADGVPIDAEGSFQTDDRTLPYRFLVVGDSGVGLTPQYDVATRMMESHGDLIVHVGDMIYPGDRPSLWNPNFFVPYEELLRGLALWPCLGNHDVRDDNGDSWRDVFYTPANNASHSENYYSFDYGNAHFVVLNSEESLRPGRPQATFLEDDLASSAAEWKFAFVHRSIYSSGAKHGSDLGLRDRLVPVFDAYHVDLVFMGHEHDYERTMPLRAGGIVGPGEGTVYITTGGGGGGLHENGESGFTAYSESVHHFVRVSVDGGTLVLEMVRADGTVGDGVRLLKGEPPRCGDDTVDQPGEQCDGADDSACPGLCLPECVCDRSPVTIEVRVGASSDDAEERAPRATKLTSRDVDLVYARTNQVVGLRFANVAIPRGATIVAAEIQFEVYAAGSGTVSLMIRGQAEDDAATFTTAPHGISSRRRTGASLSWSPGPWLAARDAGPAQLTPDLAPVIQEIVGRPGWRSGNALSIIITGTGKRSAYSYDGSPSRAPLLRVRYVLPEPPTTTSTITNTTTTITSTTSVPSTTDTTPSTMTTTTNTSTTLPRFACGDGRMNQPGEACDGADDGACPGECRDNCSCPPAQLSGVILADVSVREAQAGRNFGRNANLWVDADTAKRSFLRARVQGMAHRPAFKALLRLTVTGATKAGSVSGGRVHAMLDCAWDELTTTWQNQPLIDGPVLSEVGPVAPGDTVTFDVTPAVRGDGVYCFGLESVSSDGVAYESADGQGAPPEFAVVVATCGDGSVNQPNEQCDGADSGSGTGACRWDCTCAPEPTITTTTSITTTTLTTTTTSTTTSTTTLPAPLATFEMSVAASADDAEENSSGRLKLDSTDLDLVFTKSPQTVGLRFVDVAIPQGATIVHAYVQFRVDEADSGPVRLEIAGEATDDASGFKIVRDDISSRPRTQAVTPWMPAGWAPVGAAGAAQRTPDIARVVQEIITRPGWSSGHALALVITGTGRRVAEAYDGMPAGTPLLHIEYYAPR